MIQTLQQPLFLVWHEAGDGPINIELVGTMEEVERRTEKAKQFSDGNVTVRFCPFAVIEQIPAMQEIVEDLHGWWVHDGYKANLSPDALLRTDSDETIWMKVKRVYAALAKEARS